LKQKEIELLHRVAVAANEARTVEEVLALALGAVCAHAGWPVGHAYVLAPPDSNLVSSGIWHLRDTERFRDLREAAVATALDWGVGLPGRVWEAGRPVWVADVTADPNFPRAVEARRAGVRAAFGLPILAWQEVVGVLEFFAPEEREPDQTLLEAL